MIQWVWLSNDTYNNRNIKVIQIINRPMHLGDTEHRGKPQYLDICLRTACSYCLSAIDLLLKLFSLFFLNSLVIFSCLLHDCSFFSGPKYLSSLLSTPSLVFLHLLVSVTEAVWAEWSIPYSLSSANTQPQPKPFLGSSHMCIILSTQPASWSISFSNNNQLPTRSKQNTDHSSQTIVLLLLVTLLVAPPYR